MLGISAIAELSVSGDPLLAVSAVTTPFSRTLRVLVGRDNYVPQPATMRLPYPFDPQDQLDFKWSFLFPDGDSDSVASYTLTLDAGLVNLADGRIGNDVTVWCGVDPSATVADFTELGVTCHMVSSTTPPRRIDRTITLLVRRL